MTHPKIVPLERLKKRLERARRARRAERSPIVVFTNGCFDILHAGHVRYLAAAKKKGDLLVVGLNDDASVRRLKGSGRPVTPQRERAFVLANLACVDFVVLFKETTPLRLIKALRPDILVKGGDWKKAQIVGGREVVSWGGRVLTLPLVRDRSTTKILQRIKTL
ncbi:MAG: D-glycero-beta-D-manno-heptose 1-phosphate adenylyltransferase [Deltaproteobacteria bacterium]